jgi:hypothetical protein
VALEREAQPQLRQHVGNDGATGDARELVEQRLIRGIEQRQVELGRVARSGSAPCRSSTSFGSSASAFGAGDSSQSFGGTATPVIAER